MSANVTAIAATLKERLEVASTTLSLEFLEELRAEGPAGVAVLEAAIARAGEAREKRYRKGVLQLALGLVHGCFEEAQRSVAEPADELLRSLLLREPAALFVPRRIAAFDVLNRELDDHLFDEGREQRFRDAADRLALPSLRRPRDEDAPFERVTTKVGRNDPCPCGSGKKFKKCCESELAAIDPGPTAAELLCDAEYLPDFYALDFGEQSRLVSPEAFRAHVEILASPTRIRSFARGDAYRTLAALAREANLYAAGPRWTREAALELIEGPGHPAANRAQIASWLLETREDEAVELAPRIVAGLSRGAPLEPRDLLDLNSFLLEIDPGLAYTLLGAPTLPRASFAVSIFRAFAVRELDDDVLTLEELESARDALAAEPERRSLYVAVLEAIKSLDDPPLTLDDAFGSPPAQPLEGRHGEDEEAEPGVRSPRPSALVDRDLANRVEVALAASLDRTRGLREGVARVLADSEAAEAEVRALEHAVAEARVRASKARRALAKAEEAALDSERTAPRAALEVAARELQAAAARLRDRISTADLAAEEIAVPVLLAQAGRRGAVVVPVPAPAATGGASAALVEIALGCVAAVAEVLASAPTARLGSPADALDSLAVFLEGDGSLDAELLAVALDGAWAKLEGARDRRLSVRVCPLDGAAAEELLSRARVVDTPAPPRTEGVALDCDVPLVVAAALLGRSPFALAAELGARGLWSGATVAPSTVARLRASAPDLASPSAAQIRAPSAGPSPEGDVLDQDPHPARRTLRVILRRLLRFGKVGASHTRIDNTLRGAAPRLRGLMKDAMLALLGLGVLRRKPTLNGLHVSIEPESVPEVDRLIATGEIPWTRVRELLGVTAS